MQPYRRLALLLVLTLTLGIGAQQWSGTFTYQDNWHLLRAEANEDAAVIDLTTAGDFAHLPTDGLVLDTLGGDGKRGLGGAVGFAACAGSAADKTFTVLYVGWRRDNGMAQRLMSVAYTTGTQAVLTYPHSGGAATSKYWADTAVVTAYTGNQIISSDTGGNNGCAEVAVDAKGLYKIKAYVSNADGVTGAEAGNVSVYMYQY